ncbi:MAG: trypsin-like peptidase domain-containing protein, partial [Acaryochloridaceae cyanobacterium CSU_5_19]|nr:trypsin-like peptidase domain-containing protein [Acaryochloridaceae cyanobacterium CSU_5_19]
MKYSYSLALALLGTVPALVRAEVTQALTSPQVAAIAEQVTVRIEGSNGSGSGILIAHAGNTYYALTSKHVVENPDEYNLVLADDKRYAINSSKTKIFADVDLALVEFTSTQAYPLAKLGNSDQVQRGMTVYVAGWPYQGTAITNTTSVFQPGIVAANAKKQQADGYALIYNNNTLPGMSGGPVFNESGELIAVHGRGETDRLEKTANPSVYIKVGYNLGIPINTFLQLLAKNNL